MNHTSSSYAQLRQQLSPCDDGYTVTIPDHWRQGRTAYGGLTVGLAVAAAERQFTALPPLRSLIVNFTGPVVGNPRFTPRLLRRGKSVAAVEVTVWSEQAVAAQMVFCFGASRPSDLTVPGPVQPLYQPPQEFEPYVSAAARSLAPQFITHFEIRLVSGGRPVSAARQGHVHVVSRHVDVDSHQGIDSLVVLADVLPPAALMMATAPAPVSSVTWMMNLLCDEPRTEQGWWQLDSILTAAGDGYSSQQMRIWSLDGRLVAEGLQSVAQYF